MKCNKEIADELNTIGVTLAEISQTMPFAVPENYFISFSTRLVTKIDSVNQTLTIPEGYFAKLSDEIIKKIRAAEEEQLSPVLTRLRKTNVFAVPEGYFPQFPDKIQQVINQPVSHTGRVITPDFKSRSIWKQAAAAIITGVIAINTLWIFNQSNNGGDKITESTGISSYRIAYNQYRSPEQIDEGLSKISNDDIIKYLTSNSNESDNEALISNINENQLPDQDPALSSDQSIKSYLNN